MKQTFVKAAIMASFMAAVSCGQAPTEQGPAQYGVTTIATTDREIQSNYSATIRGRQDIDIYPQVSGTISELRVTEGQSVSKGQTLFIIDQVPYKAALQTAAVSYTHLDVYKRQGRRRTPAPASPHHCLKSSFP